jgi:hypothetical protein
MLFLWCRSYDPARVPAHPGHHGRGREQLALQRGGLGQDAEQHHHLTRPQPAWVMDFAVFLGLLP